MDGTRKADSPQSGMTFWDHLDELRTSLIRTAVAVVAFAILAFVMKDTIRMNLALPKKVLEEAMELLKEKAFG